MKMNNNIIIAISRQFGSGGRKAGLMLAQELGFNYYDRAIILRAAEKTGISPELMENLETNAASSYYFNLSQAMSAFAMPIITYDQTPNGEIFKAQADIIREIASKESAVIIGCCADYILRDYTRLINVFLHADKSDRLRRIVGEYGLSEKEAREQIKQVDKGREIYYRTFTGSDWLDIGKSDLCINTSRTGIEGAVAAIKALALEKMK